MDRKTPGWQQPATPATPHKPTSPCPHLGLIGAAFTMAQHEVGHVWVCACGDEFVVTESATFRKVARS